MATAEARLSLMGASTDAPKAWTVTANTPEGKVVLPISSQPTISTGGFSLGGRYTVLNPSPWISVTVGATAAASFGPLQSFSGNATVGGKLHLPNSYAAATLDIGASAWTVSAPGVDLSKLGAFVAAGLESQIAGPFGMFVTIGHATTGDVSQTSMLIGATYTFGPRPVPPISPSASQLDGLMALGRAREHSQKIETLSEEISGVLQNKIQKESGNLDAQLTILTQFFDWLNPNSTAENTLGLPSLYAGNFRMYARSVLDPASAAPIISEITATNRRSMSRFVKAAVSFITTGNDSLYELLTRLGVGASGANQNALKRYESCIDKMLKVLTTVLDDDSLRNYLSKEELSKLTEVKAKTTCLKTGTGCDPYKFEKRFALPSLKGSTP